MKISFAPAIGTNYPEIETNFTPSNLLGDLFKCSDCNLDILTEYIGRMNEFSRLSIKKEKEWDSKLLALQNEYLLRKEEEEEEEEYRKYF
ncbi:hypothetical protein T06_11449 [Trichinella sp. T6]|nr:hypothetical protein T06_11449 [Trichinella sp. T6]